VYLSRQIRPCPTHVPYTTLFRSARTIGRVGRNARVEAEQPDRARRDRRVADDRDDRHALAARRGFGAELDDRVGRKVDPAQYAVDRKSTRLNSSHVKISYAVFCL